MLDKYYVLYLFHIPLSDGSKSGSGCAKVQEMKENVHPNLILVVSFIYALKWNMGKVYIYSIVQYNVRQSRFKHS